ncbi:MAG: HAD-IA family hydrolase [Tissierellia bacterium]|nr:HAD-IA family hydrolase [Tissierellia bacterium]
MISTVLFDFDGTLANTNQLIINSFKHIYSAFRGDECDEEYIMSTFGEPLLTTMNRDFGKYNIEDVLACYREYQVDRFNSEVTLYDNVPEILDYLKKRKIKLGIVTSRLKNSTVTAIKNFNIDKYFDVIITADDTEKHKPHKEPLMMALNVLNSKPEETYYVGDSKFDMECAINAGATPILAGWQVNSKELIEKYNIKYVLENMWDLTKLI